MYISEIVNETITLHSHKGDKEISLVGIPYSPETVNEENFINEWNYEWEEK